MSFRQRNSKRHDSTLTQQNKNQIYFLTREQKIDEHIGSLPLEADPEIQLSKGNVSCDITVSCVVNVEVNETTSARIGGSRTKWHHHPRPPIPSSFVSQGYYKMKVPRGRPFISARAL